MIQLIYTWLNDKYQKHKGRYAPRLTEYGTNGMPPRMFHRTSATAALEILRHGLIPGGVGVSESGLEQTCRLRLLLTPS